MLKISERMSLANINIVNKKASFEYEILERYEAGIVLLGTEIKSLRQGKASISEGYCYLNKGEMFVKGMNIVEYSHGGYANHDPKRERKLLLRAIELRKLQKRVNEKGLSLVLTRLYINEKGKAKLELALGRGKHTYDKRDDIKKKDTERDMQRAMRR